MVGVTGGHWVLGVEHLVSELGHLEDPVLLAAPAGQWGEDMQAREEHHAHIWLSQISIELAWKAQVVWSALDSCSRWPSLSMQQVSFVFSKSWWTECTVGLYHRWHLQQGLLTDECNKDDNEKGGNIEKIAKIWHRDYETMLLEKWLMPQTFNVYQTNNQSLRNSTWSPG